MSAGTQLRNSIESHGVVTAPILTIGQVVTVLNDEFPDLTVSKVRFLEAAGLVVPARSPAGYRRYTPDDLDRLRYVLRAQRDNFLPLKVIADHLAAIDRGLVPPDAPDLAPRVPIAPADSPRWPRTDDGDVRITAAELEQATGLTTDQVAALQDGGLIYPNPETGLFDADALAAARAAAELAAAGLTARHLRPVRLAADRHLGIIESVVSASGHRATAGSDLDGHGASADSALGLAEHLAEQLALLEQSVVRSRLRAQAHDPGH